MAAVAYAVFFSLAAYIDSWTHDDPAVIGVLAGGTIGFGAVVGRWWAAAIPACLATIAFAIGYAIDPSCAHCGEDDWTSIISLATIVEVLPATLAIAVGVAARRLFDRGRRGPPPIARPETHG